MQNTEQLETILAQDGILFLVYGGFFSQSLIVGMIDALEKETKEHDLSMKTATNIFTIFIELAQNIMNYSKKILKESIDPKGLILVGKDSEDNYYVLSKNIVNDKDKQKIEEKLKTIKNLSKEEIKKLYRQARRSGKDTHSKGGGIGFYEIAKICKSLEYKFEPIENDRYFFQLKALIE